MVDTRDNKKYEIRKFADGKCWMVDNLAYGGTTEANGDVDACYLKNIATEHGMSIVDANTDWYQGADAMYGDCIDPAGVTTYGPGDSDDTNTCIGNTRCGYKYNWQAVMQLASAYHDNEVLYPSGYAPTADGIARDGDGNPVPNVNTRIQGICPDGWHLPSGRGSKIESEFVALDIAAGGNGAYEQTGESFTEFWKAAVNNTVTATDSWKIVFSGSSDENGVLSGQNSGGLYWSSSPSGIHNGQTLNVTVFVRPQTSNYRSRMRPVRCIKD
jgi:uncharacterized protein (TIGR02145 family)